jgi:hypothetical protein
MTGDILLYVGSMPLISPGYDRDVTEEQVRAQWERYYQEIHSQET